MLNGVPVSNLQRTSAWDCLH